MPMRLRQGDVVTVVAGKYRGKRGRVLRVLPDKNRVIVEGVNMVFKHLRRSQQNPKGGRIQREAPIHASNVMPVDPESNNPTRVSTKVVDGKRTRVGRKTGAVLGVQPAKSRKGGAKKED
jgi:large subunit ribosomal protein L24